MPHLSLAFLGGFAVTLDAEPVTAFGANKARALLAFLACEATHPHRRSKLCDMFWPDLPEKKAAHNLSQTLLRLRRALGESGDITRPAFLLTTTQTVQFNASSDYELDVARLRALLKNVEEHRHPDAPNCAACHRWLAEAAALYKGNLLAGLLVPDSVAFEEWRLLEQEELHRQAWEVLERLTAYHERRGEFERVQAYARRQLALEPWREEVHLQLIRALAQSGQPAAALKQFEHYQRTLAEELGLQPSAEARRLYTQIRAGELAQGPTAPVAAEEALWLDHQGERRQVTTLVCSRITQTGSQASPEEIEEQALACRNLCENIYHRFGGWRARRQGNACVIHFGYPQAYEDAASRAVYAALSMTAESGEHDAARIGIHTGVLVIGQSRGPSWHDRDLLGNGLEIARDCQRLAAPNEVLITEATQQLLQAAFDMQALDPVQPLATGQPLLLYRVRGASHLPSRLDWLAQTQRLTKFAGRDEELRQLETGYAAVVAGRGIAVLLRGEPGIGKSRLLWELKQRKPSAASVAPVHADSTGHWLTVRCLPYYQNTSLYPIVGLLEQLLGFRAVDSPDSRREQLTGILAWYGLDQPAALWLLSLLLGLPTPTPAPATLMPAQREQMRKLFIALIQKHATALSERAPLVLVIEDLHWSDPSTVEWLGRSLSALATAPCLVLLSARPEFSAAWLAGPDAPPNLRVLNLRPLRSEAAARMVADVAGEDRLDGDTRHRIVTQTDGNPLFIEELTKTLLEQPTLETPVPLPPNIPVTLLDSLAARLDRLGPAKETAQWAAVLGREFAYPILQACAPYAERRLQADLARLIEAELVSAVAPAQHMATRGAAPTLYQFKHALIQETAYASLLKRTRQSRHRHVAETLATRFPQIGATQPEVLAQHYFHAGLPAAAIDCWLQAGEQAIAQGATLEAEAFFDRALALIEPANHEQRWRALAGREVLFDLRGARAAQQRDIAALLELAEALDDNTRRAQALFRQMRCYLRSQEYRLAQRAAEAAVAFARRVGNPTLEVHALSNQTSALSMLGEMEAARQAVEETLVKLPRVTDEGERAYPLSNLGLYYHFVGDLARAALLFQQARHAAQSTGDRVRAGRVAQNLSFTYVQLGLYTEARALLEEERKQAEASGEQVLATALLSILGYIHWCSGDRRQALALGEVALREFRAIATSRNGQAGCQCYFGLYLADAGEWAAALPHFAEACATYTSLGNRSSAIEPQVMKASCLLALGRRDEAQQLAAAAWAYVAEHGSIGMDFPARVYLCIADVFAAQATPAIAPQTVIETGYRDIMQRAAKISDPVWRQSFLENVAEHKRLVERWQQFNSPSAI